MPDEAEAPEEVEGGLELARDAGDEKTGAADDGLADVAGGDGGGAEEEVEDRTQVGVGVAGEKAGIHGEDAARVGWTETKGVEEVGDGKEGEEGGGAEGGVEGEGLGGVDAEVVLEVEELLTEAQAGVASGGRGGGKDVRGDRTERGECGPRLRVRALGRFRGARRERGELETKGHSFLN